MLSVSPPNGGAEVSAVGAVEAVGLVGQSHGLHHGEAGARHVEQGVLFGGVHGHVILARHGGVDELDDDVGADAFDLAVAPLFEGEGGSFAAALFGRPLVAAAGGMGFDFVGRAVSDVDAPAVGLPAGNARSVMLVGVSDAAVVLFLELVLDGIRGGIAAQPELLDELLALFIGLRGA